MTLLSRSTPILARDFCMRLMPGPECGLRKTMCSGMGILLKLCLFIRTTPFKRYFLSARKIVRFLFPFFKIVYYTYEVPVQRNARTDMTGCTAAISDKPVLETSIDDDTMKILHDLKNDAA